MDKKVLDAKSIEGQLQLIDHGKKLKEKEDLENLRCEKESELDKYIEDLNFLIPDGIKTDNYQNSIMNFSIKNEEFIKKYEFSYGFNNKNTESKLLLTDLSNLFYGYKLARMRKKNLEKEIESKNKELLDFKETYKDLTTECISYEEENDKLLEKIITYKNYIIYLSLILILSNITLTFYIFLGPKKLHQDVILFSQTIRNIIFKLCLIINYMEKRNRV